MFFKQNNHYQQACAHKKPRNKPKSKTIWRVFKVAIKALVLIWKLYEIIRDCISQVSSS